MRAVLDGPPGRGGYRILVVDLGWPDRLRSVVVLGSLLAWDTVLDGLFAPVGDPLKF